MPQNATLSPVQEKALAAILAGKSVTDAAVAVNIDRATLHRWLRQDFEFQARLNAGRRELRDGLQARLLHLADEAAAVVESAINKRHDTKTARVLLRGLGLLPGELARIDSDDAGELRDEHARAAWLMGMTRIPTPQASDAS